jgi:hypothetical protein
MTDPNPKPPYLPPKGRLAWTSWEPPHAVRTQGRAVCATYGPNPGRAVTNGDGWASRATSHKDLRRETGTKPYKECEAVSIYRQIL